jgi:hypothetical protein
VLFDLSDEESNKPKLVMICFQMMSEEKLVTPEEFPFPFTPYSIQLDFMKHLYTTLEEGKLGIFESPTGTVEFLFKY